MVSYNPKTWFNLIVHSYGKHVLRMLLPALIFMAVMTFAICYFIIDYLKVDLSHFSGTTTVHSLLGIVLGLFLVFRTNSAYDRWWEGRKMWGGLVNSTRNFALKLNAYLPKEDNETRDWFAAMIHNFAFAMKEHLRKGVQFDELEQSDDQLIPNLKKVKHKPNRISALMYDKINMLYQKKVFDGFQFTNLDKELKDFIDLIGACERIKNTPIPYSYTMYIKKFIFIYILTLPFGFVIMFQYFAIPAVILIAYILLSVELIAEEIEDPFGLDVNDLPTDDISKTIRENVKEILHSYYPRAYSE
jgi:putative membrane protein